MALENALLYENLREREAGLRALFNHSPVSLWIEDFSAVKERLDGVRASGVDDLASYLAHHPELAQETLRLVRVVDVNQATLSLYGVRDLQELQERLPELIPPR